MANSRELRDPFILYYLSEVINDEEFILLYDVFSSKNLRVNVNKNHRLSKKSRTRSKIDLVHFLPVGSLI